MDCSGKRWIQACMLVASITALAGCGSDDDEGGASGASGSGGAGGTSSGGTGAVSGASGTGGDGAGAGGEPACDVPIVREDASPCVNTGEENVDCASADVTGPFTG